MKNRFWFLVFGFLIATFPIDVACADECGDLVQQLNTISDQTAKVADAAIEEDNCAIKQVRWAEAAGTVRRRMSLRQRAEAVCGERLQKGRTVSELQTTLARYEKNIVRDKEDCTDSLPAGIKPIIANSADPARTSDGQQGKDSGAKAKADAELKVKAEAEAEAKAKAAKAKAEADAKAAKAEAEAKAAKAAAQAKLDLEKKNNPPARPADPRQCITERVSPLKVGYYDYNYSNSCDVTIGFDIDDCDMAGSGFSCKVKSVSVSSKSNYFGSNYKQQPNARNFR